MQRRPSREKSRRTGSFAHAFAATLLASSVISSATAEDGSRWRINTIDDGRLLLAFTEFEATDALGTFRFYCKPGSGVIHIDGDTNEKQRLKLAELMRLDSYPRAEVEGEMSLIEPTYSEVGGWGYRIEIRADGRAFSSFKKTGSLNFKIGSLTTNYHAQTAGLNKIAEFQVACRKKPDGSVTGQAKAQ